MKQGAAIIASAISKSAPARSSSLDYLLGAQKADSGNARPSP